MVYIEVCASTHQIWFKYVNAYVRHKVVFFPKVESTAILDFEKWYIYMATFGNVNNGTFN